MMHGHEKSDSAIVATKPPNQGRATGGGGGGAKGGGQGERAPMPRVPDTGPGKRVTGAGARTDGREASRQTSEVGAVCRKAARTDLCGGRPVMGVPTAIATASSVIAIAGCAPESRFELSVPGGNESADCPLTSAPWDVCRSISSA